MIDGYVQMWENSKQCTQSTLRPFSLCGESAEAQAIFMNTQTHTHLYSITHPNQNHPLLLLYHTFTHTLFLTNNYTPILANGSAQDVQVNR